MSKKSEFYSEVLASEQVLPINCGGAREVVIQTWNVDKSGARGIITDTNNIFNGSGDIIASNYFFLPETEKGLPLVVHTNDEYLYIASTGRNLLVTVWVIR